MPSRPRRLALQESDFDALTSGPITRSGYAKGMWQFIPEIGARYGLTIGPLASQPKPDLRDDRHSWEKATVAAVRTSRISTQPTRRRRVSS